MALRTLANKIVKEKQVLKYFLIFLVIAALSQYFFIQPARQKVLQQKQKIQQINDEVQRAYEFLRDLNKIREEADKMEEQWKYFRNKLPDSKQIPSLLQSLATVANRAHIIYVAINTKPLEKGEPQGNVMYERLPIEINLRCRYRNLGEYLENLKKLPRLVKIESIRVSRNKDILPEVEALLEVYTYVLKAEG